MQALGEVDVEREAERIKRTYATPTLRSVWISDPPCAGRSEGWCLERTVRHFLALEDVFDEVRPEVVVPEVGNETIRTAAHLIALERGTPTLFLFYTIFPDPLRLYVDTMHAPIVPADAVRALDPGERARVDGFVAEFTRRAEPIRARPRPRAGLGAFAGLAKHFAVSAGERDNEYLRPERFPPQLARERYRAARARTLYDSAPAARPYVYFPLHVAEDYKIKRVIPHLADQRSLIEQVAAALPHGFDLVTKEHPLSVGRNSVNALQAIARIPNVRLVPPEVSSHELIRGAAGVVVISSTVGLEALLYAKPVLTLGSPFYSGYGLTSDVSDLAELRDRVAELPDFRPDRDRIAEFLHAAMSACLPGAPVSVDSSDENATALAGSIESSTRAAVEDRARARG